MTNGEEVDVLRAQLVAFKSLMDERDRRYEDRFTAMDEKTSLALTSSKEAVTKAELATEKRFDSVNEFRGQLKDQASTLLPRAEADAKFQSLLDKIDEGRKHAQAVGQWTLQQVIAICGLLAGLAYFIFRKP